MTADLFSGDPATVLTGVAAALCLTFGPVFRSRQSILLAQWCAGACFAVHYLSLGITAAAAANALGLVQTTAALLATRSAVVNRVGYGLIGMIVLFCLLFWQGPISLLSLLAMSLIAFGRMQTDELRLRVFILLGGLFWMAHDFIGEAWLALAADVGAFTIGFAALLAMFVRVRIEWRPASRLKPSSAV